MLIIFRGCVPEMIVPPYAVSYINIYIHIYIYITGKLAFVPFLLCMMCANNLIHYGPLVVFVCLHITMMTSSHGNIFRVTGPLCGEFTGPPEFPTQRPVTRSFDVFFDLRLNKRLNKHSWGWWFETSLWRHHNDDLKSVCMQPLNQNNPHFAKHMPWSTMRSWEWGNRHGMQ